MNIIPHEADTGNPIALTRPQIDRGKLGSDAQYSEIDISISLKRQTPQQEASEIRLKEADARLNRSIRGTSYVISVLVFAGCLLVFLLPHSTPQEREIAKDIGLLVLGGLIGVAFPKPDKTDDPKAK